MLLAVAMVGCGKDRFVYKWNDRALAAGKLHDAGKLDEAEARYRKLLETAPDAEDRRYVLNQLGNIAEERSQWAEALSLYEKVWSEPHDDEEGAHALYRTYRIVYDELGETSRGLEVARRVATKYPRSVSAEFAVRSIVGHYADARRFDELRESMDALYEEVAGEPVGDNILFETGRALEERAKDDSAALPYYRKLARAYPEGGLADDAAWQIAMIYYERQRWSPAIEWLTRLADDVETSWFVGSYNSPWANDARYELAMIDMLYLADYPGAVAHLEQYLEDFPTSLQADDAAWNIAQAYRLMGDREAYRDQLESFIEEHPESRYVSEARDILAQEAEQ